MNKFYQPHEAHIPYLLQLFIDYNLYGMNLINLAAVKFRKARRKGMVHFPVQIKGAMEPVPYKVVCTEKRVPSG